jgi:hypothetical protein
VQKYRAGNLMHADCVAGVFCCSYRDTRCQFDGAPSFFSENTGNSSIGAAFGPKMAGKARQC